MGIIIRLGNLGSGKTLCAVKDLVDNNNGLVTYSNIITKGLKNVKKLKPEMIIKKTLLHETKTGKKTFDLKVNVDYWKKLKVGVNVCIDEAHTLVNSRRSNSKLSVCVLDWIALIRRVLNESHAQSGDLIIISQLERKIDIQIRELCTCVMYHTNFYKKRCKDCNYGWNENSDSPEKLSFCPRCRSWSLEKFGHEIHIHYFANINDFYRWEYRGEKTFYRLQILRNMKKYFQFYSTAQWDDMFSEGY